ncbi:YybH family protein [Aquirufa aurantiipilula]|uniref:Nuclear transport factor 2 family protein n=1 Tax=Aquirufa aurantiipilula TaxID=2696561 RepID=A0ABT6BGD2_9BACT|nr:nuclear transport factor 2 family protein [Aquirufa aurantiipilula]MBZ1327114.1 nuclear transport factor 2 family protein [Aquirufa aurantiipilula]MDF5689320.1 nuclear transport factor 2 family protein [Aquirufa aurantiipilula]
MMGKFCLFFFLAFSSLAQTNSDEVAIRTILATQNKLWNEGDIPGFMAYYHHSNDLKFISKNGITQGWDATLARYLKSYPNQEAMGQLTFDILEVDITAAKTAWVIGKWNLARPKLGDIGGHFTLLLKKVKGKWLIFRDHTS